MTDAQPKRPMRQTERTKTVTRDLYDAVLLDLDGVITDTASLHATCWKQMFDEYLRQLAAQKGTEFRPFDPATDYRVYVDGKPRLDGVRDFLASRGVHLAEGSPDDPPQADTVAGLGNRKNELVNKAIEESGVQAYDGSVHFIHRLRQHGFKIAVVTSSQNCRTVLRAVGLDDAFEVQVDGNVIRDEQLAGKPAPDTFLAAAKLLDVEPARAVVIEDAISGVQAGRRGGFGLVIGVARKGNADELKQQGADLVVTDLSELLG
jgi:beta-phosphoglucomutase family hydrolase